MIGIFKQKNPGNLLILFIMGMLIRLPLFLHPRPYILKNTDGILYKQVIYFLDSYMHSPPLLYPMLAYCLLYLQAYWLNYIIIHHRMTPKVNYLPAMAFLLITSLLPEFSAFSALNICSLLFVIIFYLLYKGYAHHYHIGNIFSAGMVLGISTMFFEPAVFFILWATLSLVVLRPFKLNEWVLLFFGILFPYYLYYMLFLINGNFAVMESRPFRMLLMGFTKLSSSYWYLGVFFLTIFPFLTGLYILQINYGKMLMHVKKGWMLFLAYVVIACGISFFNPGQYSENWLLLCAPFAAIHALGYFNATFNLYPKVMFWLTVVFIISAQLYSQWW